MSEASRGRVVVSPSSETRRKISESLIGRFVGPKNPTWNGGRSRLANGYIYVYVGRAHKMANANGRCLEHRLVMAAAIGRMLLPTEVVHHRNMVKDDNRAENLMLFPTNAAHTAFHDYLKAGRSDAEAFALVGVAASA